MQALGIDLGSSGVRAVLLDDGAQAASASVAIAPAERWDPAVLLASVAAVLRRVDLSRVGAVAVDGTSGTLIAVGPNGAALGPLSPYSAIADPVVAARIGAVAPRESAVHGGNSALARAVALQAAWAPHRILHEADWIAGQFCGRWDATDENNALKTGYDPVARLWPGWMAEAGLRMEVLPAVLPPGAVMGSVANAAFGIRLGAVVAAGTTDGCASFLSTGAATPGDAVTALGSTLTVKLLSDAPVFSAEFGIYSHRIDDRWLTGGASNSGGAVLAAFFSPTQLETLSRQIDPARVGGLDLYPLLKPGERFPIADPALCPRMPPRGDDVTFLHGLLEGIATIEALGYRRLAEQGGSPVRRVLSVGGGAANPVWTAIRARVLGVPVLHAEDAGAALGAAMLARRALA